LRSLRICLLRLHARQEAMDGLISQLDAGRITYEPYTQSGDALSLYVRDALKEINRKVSGKQFSQSALLQAMDAASAVRTPGEEETRVAQLDRARGQIRDRMNAYLRRREAEREIKIFKEGSVSEIKIVNSQLNNVNFMVAKRIQDVRVGMESSTAKEEVKAAVGELASQAEALATKLPEDEATEVAAAVETIAAEAQKDSPTTFLVKAAGGALVAAGTKVQEFAEPIAKAVETVFKLLKIAI
jgi:hypothetical protein